MPHLEAAGVAPFLRKIPFVFCPRASVLSALQLRQRCRYVACVLDDAALKSRRLFGAGSGEQAVAV